MADRARRNLSTERQTEILEAFKRCITQHGLDGSSMRRVAAEAGVSQPLLAHHFGSRAGLVEALVRHVIDECDAALERSLGNVSEEEGSEVLLEYLFGGRFSEFAERDDILFAELDAAATRDIAIRTLLGELYVRFQQSLASHLRKAYTEASATACQSVAYGLLCLVDANEFFRAMGLPGRHSRDALANGRALMDSLTERQQ